MQKTWFLFWKEKFFYFKSVDIYCNHGQYFENFKIKFFLSSLNIALIFSLFEAFQNTNMIKSNNCFFENIFKKIENQNWKIALSRFIFNLNVKTISHFEIFSSIVLLKMIFDVFFHWFHVTLFEFQFILCLNNLIIKLYHT